MITRSFYTSCWYHLLSNFHSSPPVALATYDQPKCLASVFKVRESKRIKGGADRYVDCVTLREPEVRASFRTAYAVRTEMSKEEVTAANVRGDSTLNLLQIRARNLNSSYERLRTSHVYGEEVTFSNDSKEGDSDDKN